MGFLRLEGLPLLHAEGRADQIYPSAKEGEHQLENRQNLSPMQGLVEHDSRWHTVRQDCR